VRYASRHFRAAGLQFVQDDLETLAITSPIEVIVALNSLEDLREPERFFASARTLVDDGGVLIAGVPPVRNEDERRAHDGIHYHRAVLTVDSWLALLASAGFVTRMFLHETRDAGTIVRCDGTESQSADGRSIRLPRGRSRRIEDVADHHGRLRGHVPG
jgi:2-polyprenyl-3-methyl-5-hydroxy-6-metoxy-1,4-benzoquinol methylase